MRENRFILKK